MKEEKETVEKRQKLISKSVIVSIGVAIVYSFAGFVLSQIATRTRPRSALPSLVNEEEEEDSSCNPREDECNFMNEPTHSKTEIGSTNTDSTTSVTVSSSTTKSSSGDEACFLLPEFNNLILEEFESSMLDTCPEPNLNPPQMPSNHEIEEISFLRNMVCSLQEREKSLELQLIELSNLKEQENSISHLKNQIKVKDVETKLYALKMGSLLSENHKLRAQLSEKARTMAELDVAKEQVKNLMNRVQLLKDEMEQVHSGAESSKRMEELEEELKGLRLINARLLKEKSESVQKLELHKVENRPDTAFHTSKEIEAIEQVEILRREVEKLTTEIEQLKNSRCADLEELVYLKWINACLRYELREYHPAHGKILARDLSITLSPSSKERAKQLIQDYAFNSGPTSWDVSNWEHSSESSGDSSRISNSNKTKLFGKLKHLVLGKDENINSAEDSSRLSSWGSASTCMMEELAQPVHLQRPFEEEDKLMRSRSDAGLGYREKGVVPDFHGNGYDESEVPEKTRLKRLAIALEDPRGNMNRRAASFSFSTSNLLVLNTIRENKKEREKLNDLRERRVR